MLPGKLWGIEGAAKLCLAIIATFCFGMLLAGLLQNLHTNAPKWLPAAFRAFMLGLPDAKVEFAQMMISLVFLQGAALVWITIFLKKNGTGWSEAFGFGQPERATALAYGFAAGAIFLPAALVMQAISEWLMQLLHLTPELQVAVKELQSPDITLAEKLIFGFAAIFIAPVAEETIFRGILYPAVKQKGFPRLALWGTSIVFALMHGNEATLLPLLVFALVLVYLYEMFNNLLAPIVAHSLFNTANFLILLFQDKIDRLLHNT
ncbi:MAG TPA: type II CAAX endopeptidase family protein [Verrucomicrobiae bacterium]|jgi:membrane protease YdiL (CAAX protease family)